MKHSNITRKLVRLALAAMTLPLFACMGFAGDVPERDYHAENEYMELALTQKAADSETLCSP